MTRVKCLICDKYFDREKEPCVQIGRRYAHKVCAEKDSPQKAKELKEREDFYAYIKKIYGPNYNYQLINTQAADLMNKYGYNWTTMTKILKWFYEINGGSIEDSNGGIGIIPYAYDKARNYYLKLHETKVKNKNAGGRPSVVEIKIQSPRGWKQPPRLFDWEEDE